MALKIERKNDNRVVKAILHRIADVPGGVTVRTNNLGSKILLEGTPLRCVEAGKYEVVKTAKVIENSTDGEYTINKNSHFKVGDNVGDKTNGYAKITAIDKTHPDKDVITLNQDIGTLNAGHILTDSSETGTVDAVAGSSYDVGQGENLFVDAWIMAVIRRGNAPVISPEQEKQLKGIIYIN